MTNLKLDAEHFTANPELYPRAWLVSKDLRQTHCPALCLAMTFVIEEPFVWETTTAICASARYGGVLR